MSALLQCAPCCRARKMQVTDVEHELQEAFRVFDQEASGFISTGAFRTILRGISDGLGDDEIDEVVHIVDSDGTGRVSFSQFAALMMGGARGELVPGAASTHHAGIGRAGAAPALEAAAAGS